MKNGPELFTQGRFATSPSISQPIGETVRKVKQNQFASLP
jgi:hypothetical protein